MKERTGVHARRPGTALTPRELQSLWWKAHGLAYKEIAKKIGIGELTVKSHLRRAYARLGSHDGAHAIATCFRMGIFPPSGYVVLTIEEMASIARRRGG